MKNDRRIDELADQFEDAWNSGQRVSADVFLAQFEGKETVGQELRDELRLVEQELQRKYPTLRQIGNYEIFERIGHGGMGEVYRARHVLMDKIVAVKVVQDKIVEIPEAIKRFERELKLIGNLSHPNIVQAFGAEQIDGKLLLVMEFVEGTSLQQFVDSGKKMSMDDAIVIVRQIAAGLQYAHERQIVHRDIKPGNIMLTADGTVKILDFGLGKFYSERNDSSGQFTQTGTPVGTLDYTSPEQCRDPGGVDIRTDIYALGCTFYTVVVGEVPYPSSKFSGYTAKILAHIDQPPPSFSASGVEVSPDIETILQKMCAKEHDQRFATPQELINAIDNYRRSGTRADVVTKKRRFSWGWAVAGIVVACLLGLLFVSMHYNSKLKKELRDLVDKYEKLAKRRTLSNQDDPVLNKMEEDLLRIIEKLQRNNTDPNHDRDILNAKERMEHAKSERRKATVDKPISLEEEWTVPRGSIAPPREPPDKE